MVSLLQRLGLPTRLPSVATLAAAQEVMASMQHDKKRSADRLRFILLPQPGQATIVPDVSETEVLNVLVQLSTPVCRDERRVFLPRTAAAVEVDPDSLSAAAGLRTGSTPPWLSACDDVQVMQAAIAALTARPSPSAATTPIVEADCGEAGLVLRLCLAFAARRGRYLLRGFALLAGASPRPTLAALRMLGSQIEQA